VKKNLFLWICSWLLLSACVGTTSAESGGRLPPAEAAPAQTAALAVTAQNEPTAAPALAKKRVWLGPGVPEAVAGEVSAREDLERVDEPALADIWLQAQGAEAAEDVVSTWVYALVAPFHTVQDGLALADLRKAWQGEPTRGYRDLRLRVSAATWAAFESRWGPASETVVQVWQGGDLFDGAQPDQRVWALVPFEELVPRWKVLHVNGLSPLQRDLNGEQYPLRVSIRAVALGGQPAKLDGLPASNRDESKMTVLAMSGTTALVRYTALRMEEKGPEYPADKIGAWLRSADLTHISNEVSFYAACPAAKPLRREARFCSDPAYIQLLKFIDANVVELTGNHLLDWGPQAFLESLALYEQEGFPYYGGGRDLQQAMQPLIVEDHGNRIAFLGCNAMGPPVDWATSTTPGSAPCDLDWMEEQIKALRSQGILPVVTFQHFELDDFRPQSGQRVDFQRMAAAGAVIVSGSQAHHPQAVTFRQGAFVHYGLGNLFFDQMQGNNRKGLVDRHIFYDGQYISTELYTTMLEDYAQPRPMTPQERAKFLQALFDASEAPR